MRHDIDGAADFAATKELAYIEHAFNIKATYFILPHESIGSPIFKEWLEYIESLNHSVGIHIDAGQFMPMGVGLKAYLKAGLAALGKPTLCSGHGTIKSHQYGYSYEIWILFNRRVNAGLNYRGAKLRMRKYGLKQDLSMLLPDQYYLGDSMGQWHYYTPEIGKPVPYEGSLPIIKDPTEVINKWKASDQNMQVLIHPGYSL